MQGDIPFFLAWMKGIQRSELPSTTRLVLFNLGMYMNSKCRTCYPSMKTQAEDTGLNKRTVNDHIQKAVKRGWLSKSKKDPDSGKNWKRNAYKATFPEDFDRIESYSPPREVDGESKSDTGESISTESLKEAQSNTNQNSSRNTNDQDGISEEELRQMAEECDPRFINDQLKKKIREQGLELNGK